MSARDSINSSENENLCVVCFKNVEFFSIGVCDHPVCFECSTRMRVLCKQNECPICRQDMPKVIFTKTVEPFSVLFPKFERSNLQDRKLGVYFCTSDIQKAFNKILEHSCQICGDYDRKWSFKTFQQLKDHMRREHELFYCDICTDNLKIFSFEKRCYTRQELGHHRRKGDPDNTSHRGHPLCEFCDARFMDSEELFRHLRRVHLYCHFCDVDGKYQFYNNMDDLVRHFRDEHYLCEDGECKSMPLTAVFRTDIDCKAHKATEHGRYMSKSATKQARTLEVEFTLAPRPRNDNLRNRRYNDRRDRIDEDLSMGGYNVEPGGPGGGNEERSRLFVNPLTSQDFPALGAAAGNITLHTRPTTTVNFTSRLNSNFSKEDFPSLGGPKSAPAVTITTNSSSSASNRTPEVTITRTVAGQQLVAAKKKDNFPALGGPSGSSTVRLSVNSSQDSKAPKVSIQVNHRPNGSVTTHITTSASSSVQQRPTEAFPALGSATSLAQPQWVQVKSKKQPQDAKNVKVAAAPVLPPSNLEQFPTLSKKKSSVSMPLSNNWVNLNSINSTSSKNASLKTNYSSNSVDNASSSDINVKKSEKPASSKQKQTPLEAKFHDLKVGDNGDFKSRSKKKKSKISETDTNKMPNSNESKPSKINEAIINETVDNAERVETIIEKNSKNSNVKKRSELRIGTLTTTGEASVVSNNEFPALGDAKPPPGFNIKPPPGLAPSSFPSLGVANDLTFTSSSGQKYSIKPSNDYCQPSNFQSRNHLLIERFKSILNNDAIKEFKTYSDLFRKGGYPTYKYYEHCKEILGNDFEVVFPELLVLLPDVEKQQELYRAYDGKNKDRLIACENCKQIIYRRELGDHYNYHVLDNQFPILGKALQENNAWRK